MELQPLQQFFYPHFNIIHDAEARVVNLSQVMVEIIKGFVPYELNDKSLEELQQVALIDQRQRWRAIQVIVLSPNTI